MPRQAVARTTAGIYDAARMNGTRLLLFVCGGGLFLGLFVAALLLASPAGKSRANRLLSLLSILCSLNIAHLLWFIAWPETFPFRASSLTEPLQFLMAPLIAAYFRALIRPETPPHPREVLHALPFALVVAFGISPLSAALERAAGGTRMAAVLWALLLVQALCYFVPALRLLHDYRRALRDQASNLSRIDLRWLMWFAHLILGLCLAYAAVLVLMLHGPSSFPLRSLLSFFLSVFVIALGYRGLLQKEPPAVASREPPGSDAAKYQRGVVPPTEAARLQEKLGEVMERGKLYLDPDLDLSTLAAAAGAARNQLSYVINQNLGKNFYDYVNGYRVREVLRLMDDTRRDEEKMITLAFEAGFNSKPTFNLVFKKLTGVTPSQYRAKRRNRV
jgi:AraC-like DNA-binding protein